MPSGVTSIVIDAYGAEGGIGQRGYTVNVNPGKGGRVQATLSVTAGEALYIYIGGEGSLHNNSGDDGEGGWNGGGDGGSWGSGGGGGGGYYGGGGIWEGAGGGNSWVTTSGSSNIIHTQGARSGNGTMDISW